MVIRTRDTAIQRNREGVGRQIAQITEDVAAGGIRVGKRGAMFAAHHVHVLVQEVERDGAAVTGSGGAFPVVGRHGHLVGPEKAVECPPAETWDVLTH